MAPRNRAVDPIRQFRDESLREIAFPLGGIGTGMVSLGGYGNLRDWEIFNRPAKGLNLPWTFFALWAKRGGAKPVTKVLQRRLLPPYSGRSGVPRGNVAGLPHLRDCTFRGSYPIARIDFDDEDLPLQVALDAFNPMVPLDVEASGLPVAVLVWELANPLRKAVEATVLFSIANPIGLPTPPWEFDRLNHPELGQQRADVMQDGGVGGLLLSNARLPKDDVRFGTLAVATPFSDLTYQCHWRRGAWFDELHWWWDDFTEDGRLDEIGPEPSPDGRTDIASVGVPMRVEAGQRLRIPFVLAWHFPNNTVPGWRREPGTPEPVNPGNYYATRFADAWDAARQTVANLPELEERTRIFADTLYSGTLPPEVLDAAGSQMSIIRTPTCLHFADGKFAAWEGCGDVIGCCHGSCTHVWNYEQALAHLYPSLERSMRETDFLRATRDDGHMGFRVNLPLLTPSSNHAAADGQLGGILKLYREWQLCGDEEWLKKLWPGAKRALEYAWTCWDRDRDGAMEGEQHNTYDIEFYGYTTMTGSIYLGALLAAAEIAEHLGDRASADTYRKLLASGREKYMKECWNGEYFQQQIVDPETLGPRAPGAFGPAPVKVDGEYKYQYGPGCLTDQLLGQWFAHVVGLGYVLPEKAVRKALGAVFKHNFCADLSGYANAQRVYAVNDEAALLLCTWPRGGRPKLPLVYGEEAWTGIEYQAAAHLIYEGKIDEGLRVVRAVRDRYAGHNRNPWDEVECGHHYARAMSSWSLILALSGVSYSAVKQELAFAPKLYPNNFRTFFSTGTAWGQYTQRLQRNKLTATLTVHAGQLTLKRFGVARADVHTGLRPRAHLGEQPIAVSAGRQGDRLFVDFTRLVQFGAGQSLIVQWS